MIASDLFSVYLKTFVRLLNLEILIFSRHAASFKIDNTKAGEFGNFE